MGIFDSLKKTAGSAMNSMSSKKSETFTFTALPESVEQMKMLPEASLDTPFKTAALTICAFCAYAAAPEIGVQMLNFLKGPQPLSGMDLSFLKDRFRDGAYYLPFSYFAGATPDNDYTPSEPFTVTFETNPYSYTNAGYVKLFVRSGGADSIRSLILRQKGDGQWFLWEYSGLVMSIRTPKSQNPWA